MSSDTNDHKVFYNSSDMAAMVDVQESTVRKYCNMLEKAGYTFIRNDFNHRVFRNEDVMAFRRLIEIKKHPDMSLIQACNAVVSWVKEKEQGMDVASGDMHDTGEINGEDRYEELVREFSEFKEQQEQFNKELIDQLKKQHQYIEDSISKRDRTLMEALRETQETKKLIATSQEEEEQNKKGFFARLFNL